MVELNQILDLEIARITGDGKGISFAQDGTLILIDGVDEEDKKVRVTITQVFEETAFAKKQSRIRAEASQPKRKDLVDSPYDLDLDEEDEDVD